MICREQDEKFVMIKQHDHGLLAGEFAARFRIEQVPRKRRLDEVLYAIGNHDWGWIDLDEIEAVTPYGALLCSLHFERLIEISGESSPELTLYLQEERRSRIHRELESSGAATFEAELYYDSRLLQFCDDLSLYIGLNEPGTPKSQEHPWWKNGFSSTGEFDFTGGRVITAEWRGTTLLLDPYPFTESFEVTLPVRRVPRSGAVSRGLAAEYSDTPETAITITLAEGELK
ncbi:DUF3891 family protein [Paenibacillus durus]|uniref:DUF3891 domain-containing protein n=1 Tax=Paenibacillus durus TaxID=44251 RepID=A0A089HQG2_PAEDU|nr:DUF3891 family protein [Paenibacillus durus]AIQ14261.1 hypothetical protein PDUR_21905 [Paenibacillus durus]